ncbi:MULTISPECIES: flavin reductase family protein [unclassified Pseudofrankia]|uniref:flavin reductase family protein n=1 Tax=unclassified Pseudofrankia TaxID=2994372 RepID=UPI0008D9E105|nr:MULTISPECIES: flavin reductase family protein [unclassified Pseudofrankia]MDT3442982.1 flavin reductase family protein [Pseudofrankia sp. BMG5.37]OHV43009.1 flavin reductase [Pseudofrankia sp. BMG5.36]
MPNRAPSPSSQRAASRPLSDSLDEAGAEAMRRAFRRHAAGVTIVTMSGQRGPVGFTATSVASLSERPPLLALALSVRSSIAPTLRAAETLLVHLLSRDQQDLAARFAAPGADRFAAPTRWRRLDTGEPLLLDAATWLRCRIRDRSATGDHWLVVAEVLESRVDPTAEPLVYHDGGYGTVLKSDDGPANSGPKAGDGGGKANDGDLGIRGRSPSGS